MEKKKLREITIEFAEDDFCGLLKFQDFFERHLSAGDKIPARVIKLLLKKVHIKTKRQIAELGQRFAELKGAVLKRYGKDEDYKFKFTYEEDERSFDYPSFELVSENGEKKRPKARAASAEPPKKVKRHMSFQKMIDGLFYDMEINATRFVEEIPYDQHRDALAKGIYDFISDYVGRSKNPPFGKYKCYALTGYMIWKLGYPLTDKVKSSALNGKEPSNEMLFEAIKYPLGKKLPKAKKKKG